MPTLRAIRRSAAAFDGRFFERSPLFWPIRMPARAFEDERDWPDVPSYARVFAGEAPVRFEAMAAPPRRKRRAPVDPSTLYDARITDEGLVPTRPRSWHDFLNALVWGAFPRSKRALHRRQHEALASRIEAGASRLPATRSREHDALALIDEGGVVLLTASRAEVGVVFGHALYEGLVLGVRAMAARVVVADVAALPEDHEGRVRMADAALERALTSGVVVPEVLPRVALAALRP